jgi:hypothetical protein
MIRDDEYRPAAKWRVGALIVVGIASIGFALIRIKTLLGVEALTVIGVDTNGDPIYDKDGRDAIWRIWWRARDDFMPGDPPQVLVTGALLLLLALFVAGLLVAVWSALSPDPDFPVERE